MKIRTNAGVLSRLLQIVVRAVPGRATIQLLSAVLFEAKDGVLKMSVTDMEMSISLAAQAPIEEEGRVAIPARVLLEIAKSLPEGELAIEADEAKATLSHGKNSYDLRVYDPKDYPKLPAFPAEEDARFAVPAKPLAGAVRKVLPSVSKDDTRPVLTGVLVSFEGGKWRMVSTDSYRLSINEVELGGSPKEPGQAIIPGRALKEVARLSELAETVEVALTENAALFRVKGIVVGSRLIDGNFPEYERLLPGSFAEEFAVDAGALKDSLKRVNLFAARQNPPIPVKLAFSHAEGTLSGGELEISVQSSEMGGATERIAADVPEGKSFEITFNPAYLMDGVATAGAEKVVFGLNEPLKPAMLRGAEEDGGEDDAAKDGGQGTLGKTGADGSARGFSYLLMPMRDPASKEG